MEKPPTTLPEATPPEKGPTAGEALFAALDKDNDGTISKSELAAGIAAGLAGLVELQEQEKFSVEMTSMEATRCDVPVTAEVGLDVSKVLEAQVFKDWVVDIDKDPKLFVKDIHVQSLDMFGPRVGFIKFRATAQVKVGGEKGIITVPGIVFMRGGAVGVLVILECDGKEFTLLTKQARVPVGLSELPEIPAGMLDGSGHFKGVAAEEIAEECNIVISEEELVDLTELAWGGKFNGMLPSAGGCDEFIKLFVCRLAVEPAVLSELQGRLTGLLAEGEHIKLQIIPLEDLWKSTPDAKALGALALFDCLRAQGMLPESVRRDATSEVKMNAAKIGDGTQQDGVEQYEDEETLTVLEDGDERAPRRMSVEDLMTGAGDRAGEDGAAAGSDRPDSRGSGLRIGSRASSKFSDGASRVSFRRSGRVNGQNSSSSRRTVKEQSTELAQLRALLESATSKNAALQQALLELTGEQAQVGAD